MSENGVKKYVVRLSEAEREALEAFIRTGKRPAAQVLKPSLACSVARILLRPMSPRPARAGVTDGL
jgi:hypothetical protein